MATRKNKTKAKRPVKTAESRRLKPAKYKSFTRAKRIKHPKTLASSFSVFKQALKSLKNHWKIFLTIGIIYALLTVILVKGFGGTINLNELKAALQDGLGGDYSNLVTSATLFSYLLGSLGTSATPTGGVYQSVLIIVFSLVIIWALRQLLAGQKIKTKDAFYKGTYALVPFVLVLLVIGLQLLPLTIGSWLYATVIANAIAITALEKFIWAMLALTLATLSLYMICSSIFALYIVTLPDMTPLKALRSARQLVLYRRFSVLRKILFLPLALLVLGAIITLPILLWAAVIAEWMFFALSIAGFVMAHTYMYTLYRELL